MPRGFYVSAKDGPRSTLLCGPFATLPEAEAMVGTVKRLTTDCVAAAAFWSYGTAEYFHPTIPMLPEGTLHSRLRLAGQHWDRSTDPDSPRPTIPRTL